MRPSGLAFVLYAWSACSFFWRDAAGKSLFSGGGKVKSDSPLFARNDGGNAAAVAGENRYRRIYEGQPQQQQRGRLYDKRAYRQAAAIESELDLKRNQLNLLKRDRTRKRDTVFGSALKRQTPYGIVYGNGKPVGILEPYPQAYELASYENAAESDEDDPQQSKSQVVDVRYPMSRITGGGARSSAASAYQQPQQLEEEDAEKDDGDAYYEASKFADEKYPSVLANFKIDNRLKLGRLSAGASNKDEQGVKHSTSMKTDIEKRSPQPAAADDRQRFADITQDKIDELKVQLQKLQNPSAADNLIEIEENLKNVLEDMGLIDEKGGAKADGAVAAAAGGEDENLDEGVNKIELTKEGRVDEAVKVNERNKRDEEEEDEAGKQAKLVEKSSKAVKLPDSQLADDEAPSKSLAKRSEKNAEDTAAVAVEPEIANYQSAGEAFLRSKRQQQKDEQKRESDGVDIMKGLEKSGELTVSGNKSPLASKAESMDAESKRKAANLRTTCPPENQEISTETIDYERRIERDLQAKIDAIKEQVKREIDSMKNAELLSKSPAAASADNQQQQEVPGSGGKRKRKKRDTAAAGAENTLLDEETGLLDPGLDTDETLKPLVRRRRRSSDDDDGGDEGAIKKRSLKSYEDDAAKDEEEGEDEGAAAVAEDGGQKVSDDSTSNTEKKTEAARAAVDAAPKEDASSAVAASTDAKQIEKKSGDESESKPADLKKQNEEDKEEDGKREAKVNGAAPEDVTAAAKEKSEREKKDDKTTNTDNNSNEDDEKKRSVAVDDSERREAPSSASLSGDRERGEDGGDDDDAVAGEDVQNGDGRRRRRRRHAGGKPRKVSAAAAAADADDGPYLKLREDSDEMDDEGAEFDDDGFDDRTANLMKKRQAANYYNYYNQQQSPQDDQKEGDDDYPGALADEAEEDYGDADEGGDGGGGAYARKKRDEDGADERMVAAIHGGGPMTSHLAAIRDRNQINEAAGAARRRKRKLLKRLAAAAAEARDGGEGDDQLSELSEQDLFGGLPQSYQGELSRFKRVKRHEEAAV